MGVLGLSARALRKRGSEASCSRTVGGVSGVVGSIGAFLVHARKDLAQVGDSCGFGSAEITSGCEADAVEIVLEFGEEVRRSAGIAGYRDEQGSRPRDKPGAFPEISARARLRRAPGARRGNMFCCRRGG
jgi:hypothetical protein